MSTTFNSDFEVALEFLHPRLHEMHVLEHDPVTFFSGFGQNCICIIFLTLSHRDVCECPIFDLLTICEADLFNIRSWINTREKNKESWSKSFGLLV